MHQPKKIIECKTKAGIATAGLALSALIMDNVVTHHESWHGDTYLAPLYFLGGNDPITASLLFFASLSLLRNAWLEYDKHGLFHRQSSAGKFGSNHYTTPTYVTISLSLIAALSVYGLLVGILSSQGVNLHGIVSGDMGTKSSVLKTSTYFLTYGLMGAGLIGAGWFKQHGGDRPVQPAGVLGIAGYLDPTGLAHEGRKSTPALTRTTPTLRG